MPKVFASSLITVLCFCAACGSDDKEKAETGSAESGVRGEGVAGETSSGNEDENGVKAVGDAGQSAPDKEITPTCGNKVKEGSEECDDGNKNDKDGCTTLCVFTCRDNYECQQDPCADSKAYCDKKNTHKCISGEGRSTDGATCGDNKSCFEGSCVENVCNNGIKQSGEECDDGNDDDHDGCTTKCKYTCVTGDKNHTDCANDCDFNAKCNDASHTCIAVKPLADNASCKNGNGYCANGWCVASVCGDGQQQPNEECDKGGQNGVSGSGCAAKCTLTVCGNGVIEGNEQCDDGNTTPLDGCDSHCKLDWAYRIATTVISFEAAPDWCVYTPGNSLNPNKDKNRSNGNAFAKIITSDQAKQIADLFNEMSAQSFSNETGSTITTLMDVDNPKCTTPDPFVRAGLIFGIPEAGSDWKNTSNKLDFPMQVYRQYFNDQYDPLITAYGELKIDPSSGRAISQATRPFKMHLQPKPIDASAGDDVMTGVAPTTILRNVLLRAEIDAPKSKPAVPPESAAGTLVPESSGNFNPEGTTDPKGILCGALDPLMLEQIPLPEVKIAGLNIDVAALCSDQYNGSTVKVCKNKAELDAGKCSSVLDIFKAGCTSSLGQISAPLGEPDADTNGDGIYDSYTFVLRVAMQRIRLSTKGFVQGAPPFEIITSP